MKKVVYFLIPILVLIIGCLKTTYIFAQSHSREPIVDFSKKVVREEESYQIIINNYANYQGKINLKSKFCDYQNPSSCNQENLTQNWGPNGGWNFVNGTAQIQLVPAARYGFYHMKFQIPGDNSNPWSVEYILTIIPKQATENYMRQTTNQLFANLDKGYTLENQPGLDPHQNGIDTIAEVDQNYSSLSQVDLANKTVELFTGKIPNCSAKDSSCRESLANWRKKAAARHLMLATFYAYRIETQEDSLSTDTIASLKDKIATHAYLVLLHLDMLSSLPQHGSTIASLNPDVQNEDQRFTLGDTGYAQRYLPDFGMGGLKGLSIIKQMGLLPDTFCSYYERFTADNLSTDSNGKSCRLINFNQRMAQVASAIAISVSTRWVYTGPDTYRQQYGDDLQFWQKLKQSQGFNVTPNNIDPNIVDLNNRKYIVAHPISQFMKPNFYSWQMSGMTMASDIVLKLADLSVDQKQLYTFLKQWGTKAVAYELALPSTNEYGQSTKGMLNDYCDGTVTTVNFDGKQIQDCVGGHYEYFSNFSQGYPSLPTLVGDNWQHLGVVMFANDWQDLPNDYQKTAIDKKITLIRTIWKDDQPYIDFANATFNYQNINTFWPNNICQCSTQSSNCHFYFQSINGQTKVVGSSNEYAHDFIISAIPPYYQMMMALGRTDDAKYMLGYNYLIYQSLLDNPINPTIEFCGQGSRFAGGDTQLGSVLRTGAFLFQTAYPAWNKISLASSNSASCVSKFSNFTINDLIVWYAQYRSNSYNQNADFDCDTKINIDDLIYWYTGYRDK